MDTIKLKKIIAAEVLKSDNEHDLYGSDGEKVKWLFDFREILLKPEYISHIAELIWKHCEKDYPFQVGGLESASIPLITALVIKSAEKGKPVNGFFIRKSRKKYGRMRQVEGTLTNDKIILIDDVMNSGKGFERQIAILKSLNKEVTKIITLIRFRDSDIYKSIKDEGIEIISLLTLEDFEMTPLNRIGKKTPQRNIFDIKWYFKSQDPNYFHVVPKSKPVLDELRLYFGSDNRIFWALNQSDGSVAWKFKVGPHIKGKSIFSSPTLHNNKVYFGSYDGNFYALNTETGKKEWVFMEADWIGSSPTIAQDLNLVYVGLEYGLFTKKGGIVALDTTSGEKKWEYIVDGFVHSSPAYYAPKKNCSHRVQ